MAHDRQNNVTKRKRGRPKTNRGNADRISALPDSVLCHILSYIPTKHAVATSVIAKRWQNVWTAVPNLSFDDRLCLRPPASTYVPLRGFADFVHTVLLRTNPAKIGKFSLYCSRPTNLARFYDWIATALMREVGEIQLYLGQQSPWSYRKPFTVQPVLNCPSLEELSVTCELHDDTPPPNLIISSATLKTCKLIVRSEDMLFREVDYMLTITAPKLESLEIYSDLLGSFVMHDLHSLKKVKLDIMHAEWAQVDPYRAIQLLAGINSCKYLHLSAGIMSAVDHACDSCFPSFSQLNYIEMGVGPIRWRVLPIVLRSSPNLESLVLHKFGWLESDFDVPHCLVHTVKNIEIKGVQGDEDERPLLKYLLQFAATMEKMLMWAKASVPKENRANLRESILQLPRASMKTTIEIK
ncbi:putative F-box protein At3g44060 [Citrus clementina]|uniref:putative F-box protein At3g44060 n=1 Tax=Citrus clementina TaxID=85681 RepID=UPI000CED5259|nr:putative F-box protein At3g44060 [Citrus x clementina]